MAGLATRVVAPVCPAAALAGGPIGILTPALDIYGNQYVIVTPQLAGISAGQLGPALANLSARRGEIKAALDLLFKGI